MTQIFYPPFSKFSSSTMQPLPGALLYFYENGTTTLKDTYMSDNITPANKHENPVEANSEGNFPVIYLNGTYSVKLTNAAGAVQSGWPVDDVGDVAGGTFEVAPNTTITLTIGTDYATLAACLTGIDGWVIPNTSYVNIVLPSGTTANTTAIVVNHKYGTQIKFTGTTPVTTTASASGAVSGAAGAWSVPITVASVSGIAVNDWVIVRNLTGTGRYYLFAGFHKITGIAGNVITVTNTAQVAAWPTAAISTADIVVLKTIYSFTNCDGFQINSALGYMNNIAIVGNRGSGSIGLITNRMQVPYKNVGSVYLGNAMGISSFGDGCVFAQYGGVIDARYLCVSDAIVYNALAQHGGHLFMNDGISSGGSGSSGTGAGIAATNSGAVSAENAITVGHAVYGAWCISSGAIVAVSLVAWCNVVRNVQVDYNGSIRGQLINSQYSGSDGVMCKAGGTIVCPSSVSSNNAGVGWYSEGGDMSLDSCTGSSNTSYGFYCDGGYIDARNSTASSNSINGFTAVRGGVMNASGSTGTGNATYLFSANQAGYIRASSSSTSGATVYSENLGLIDLTSATGTPVLSYGPEGRFIDTGGTLISGTLKIQKNSTYNSESTASITFQNATTPLKMCVMGYDVTQDYAYIQSLHSTVANKNLAINPSGGNVSIKLGTTAPTAALHLPASTTAAGTAPLKLTSGSIMTTPENMAIETDGTDIYFTNNAGTRKKFTLV
jgi:hypothetical protein